MKPLFKSNLLYLDKTCTKLYALLTFSQLAQGQLV